MAKENESGEPEVSVFGNKFSRWDRNHNSGSSVFGAFVLLAGIMLLLNTLGIVPWEFWNQVWQFWPVLLVLGGIHIILGNGYISRIILFIISLIIFGMIICWGLNQINSNLVKYFPTQVQDMVNRWETNKK